MQVRAPYVAAVAVVATGAWAACRSPSGPGAEPPPGCYRLTIGVWQGQPRLGTYPTHLALREVQATGFPVGHRAVELFPEGEYPHPIGTWLLLAADRLRITLSASRSESSDRLHLVRGDNAWEGRLEQLIDVEPAVQASASASLLVDAAGCGDAG